jgi:hypothetical protein
MPDDLTPPRQQGHSREYLLDRLRREGHDGWVEAIEAGRVSAFEVACELGWTQRPPTRSGERANQAKRRQYRLAEEHKRMVDGGRLQPPPGSSKAPDKLTDAQENFLRYGPKDAYDSAFSDGAEVLTAWAQHRDRILRDYQNGRRPWGWRAIDRPRLPWKGFDRERSGLWRAGVLTEAERTQLETHWRKAFEQAQDLDEAASKAHFAWADIPRELILRWTAERRRRSVCNPSAEAQLLGAEQRVEIAKGDIEAIE